MNAAMLILLFVTVFGLGMVQCAGLVGGGTERCVCQGKPQRGVPRKLIQAVQVFPESLMCAKTEIVVTLQTPRGKVHVCIDPKGTQGRRLLKKRQQRGQKRPNQKRGKKQRKQ
ncbi:hypothetical protein MATL_G00091670 [Megalops atlanticus]|uniref:Chemokine interleukin-8-like domain-containing protein n=1 Tax=Megalops atlanticus TaxID=7932 RepID=A0A9D3Q3P2_MEGAT|nr:hypothetical protein MATL_G00091670 [Megalops atlanticus]